MGLSLSTGMSDAQAARLASEYAREGDLAAAFGGLATQADLAAAAAGRPAAAALADPADYADHQDLAGRCVCPAGGTLQPWDLQQSVLDALDAQAAVRRGQHLPSAGLAYASALDALIPSPAAPYATAGAARAALDGKVRADDLPPHGRAPLPGMLAAADLAGRHPALRCANVGDRAQVCSVGHNLDFRAHIDPTLDCAPADVELPHGQGAVRVYGCARTAQQIDAARERALAGVAGLEWRWSHQEASPDPAGPIAFSRCYHEAYCPPSATLSNGAKACASTDCVRQGLSLATGKRHERALACGDGATAYRCM